MQPTRFVQLDPANPLEALTATARGMIDGNFVRAAQRAHTELMTAVAEAGQLTAVRSRLGLFPDEPSGPDDARCRYLAGVLFGHDLARGEGACVRPSIPMRGSLSWMPLPPGRHVVFTHVGPYDTLHVTWQAIYRDWLPRSGEVPRQAPPMELSLDLPEDVAPEALRTEIWLPLS